jgi:hypothetical protein
VLLNLTVVFVILVEKLASGALFLTFLSIFILYDFDTVAEPSDTFNVTV